MNSDVRSRAVKKMLVGTLGVILVGGLLYVIRRFGFVPSSFFAMIPLAMPGVYALTGILELISDVPFADIAIKWDQLAGWRRGILGVLVVVLAFAIAATAMVLSGQP